MENKTIQKRLHAFMTVHDSLPANALYFYF